MNGMKKILSWLLIVCMVLGMVPAISLTAEAANVYTKVTSAPSDWSGTYLIVYEAGDGTGVALNGALETVDAASNTVDVTISDNQITGSTAIDAATVTIAAIEGGYSIYTSSGRYIGQTSDANGLKYNKSTVYTNSLSMNDDGTVNIASGGAMLRYNSASDQLRFRYFKSSTYTKQKAIALYKLGDGGNEGGSTGGDSGSGDNGEGDSTTTVLSGDAYVRVMSASDLIAGESYVIAAADSDLAMSTTQNENNRGQAAVTKSEDVLAAPADVQEFVLGAGTIAGTYSFKLADGSGYIYAASNAKNWLRTETALSADSSWSIFVSSAGVATITAQGENTHNTLRYNSSSDIFSCYAAENSQKDVALYRKVYTLVTDASQLQLGDSIVIASKDRDYAMSKMQTSTNRTGAAATKSPADSGYALTFVSSANVREFILKEGLTTDSYAFYDTSLGGYIYAASSTANLLKTNTLLSANSSWAIDVTSDGIATLTAQGSNTHNTLKFNYNSGTPIFSAYLPTSTSTEIENIAIYRKATRTETHIATFYVAEEVDSTVVTSGAVDLPEDTAFSGYTFVGWVKTESAELIAGTTTKPTCLTGSVTISTDTSFYAVFVLNGTYTTRPVMEENTTVEASMKIITGEGTAYFSVDGGKTRYKEAATEKGTEVRNDVTGLDTLTLVVKPAEGYRIACLEHSSDRLFLSTDYVYDATIGAYIYTFTVNKTSSAKNYFRISFLPRISDGGYTAKQITGWDETDASGLYVITGLQEPENYSTNSHSASTTYLLYSDHDTAKDDNFEAIGRKSSALQLSSIGVSLGATSPYLMTGLSKNHLMKFEKYTYDNKTYYTIVLYGATDEEEDHIHYLCARTSGATVYTDTSVLESDNSVNLYALWSVSYLDNGAVAIENAGHAAKAAADTSGKTDTRFLMFNSNNRNLLFRCYPADSSTADFPILYSASHDYYKVTYSFTGSGSEKVTNGTATVASGSNQAAGSTIKFAFKPAPGYQLTSVTVNGAAVTVTNNTYTYTDLDQDLNVVAVFTELDPVTFTVQYYLNGTLNETVKVTNKTPYVIDASVKLTFNKASYPASDFSFDYSINGTETYYAIDAEVEVKAGDVIKAYFSTTDVTRTKVVTEVTIDGADDPTHGGTGDNQYTDGNDQDVHNNVKQVFHIDLHVKSNDMIEETVKGGNTDVILVLDHSNSMYQPYSDNADYIKTAVTQFANIVLKDTTAKNRIAIVQYDTYASAWNGSKLVGFQWIGPDGEAEWDRTVANYGLTYNKCFMTTEKQVSTALAAAMSEPDTEYTSGGLTNMMGGFFMTDLVARTRSTSTTRDLVIIMFTDGLPSCRYLTSTRFTQDDSDGYRTSAWEYLRTMEEAQNLRTSLNTYKKCTSTIYNIALLNNSDINSQDKQIIRALMSTDKTYQWVYKTDEYVAEYNYPNLREYIGTIGTTTKYLKPIDSYADVYKEITGSITQNTLKDLYEDIAYEYVAAKYVTGTISDVIPEDFILTEESKAELISQGCTITYNADGTTTITKEVTANQTGDGISYDVIYQGPGCGGVYTNEYATFAYSNLDTGETNTAYFPKPTVAAIPWTVNDREFAQINTPITIDILANDLFFDLIEGGYSILDCTVTLVDADGNPAIYNDAIEQSNYCFDATLDTASNTVVYYTEKGGSGTFYYIVSVNVRGADGTVTTVNSRATRVDVLVTSLDKTAKEVTQATLPQDISVATDQYGNVRQLYLVTLAVNLFDITNGKITDKIPSDFQFVRFEETSGLTCVYDETTNTITCSNINIDTEGAVISYYLRYIGTGYGVRPTNDSATISYTNSNNVSMVDEFSVPTAGLNPFTVNDVDIAKAGTENTLHIEENDLYSDSAYAEEGYTVTAAKTYLTDETGRALSSSEIAALGIDIKVNTDDGSITYTAPDATGTTQFYYVVESKVTELDGNNFAESNSTTLVSRPTLVTLYTVKDIYIIVDFGLDTMKLDFIDYSGVTVDQANNIQLDSLLPNSEQKLLTTGAFNETQYGELILTDGTKEISFRPATTVFNQTAKYTCQLTLAESDYNKSAKTLDVHFNVIPANNIYFEEYFIDFDSAWIDSETVTYDATQNAGDYHNGQLHGYDDAYAAQEAHSDGSQKEVTVCAHDREHNGYFTFAGTGFDIIGTTNENSGVVVAEVYKYDASKENGLGEKVKNILVDTWLPGKSYEQLPIIQFRASEYGVYRVKIRAFYNEIFDHNYEPAKALAFNNSSKTFTVINESSVTGAAYCDVTLVQSGEGYVIAAKTTVDNAEVYYAMANSFDGSATTFDPVAMTFAEGTLSDYLVTMTEVDAYYTIFNGTNYLSYDGISMYADSDAYNWKKVNGEDDTTRLYVAETLPCVPTYRNSMSKIRSLLGIGATEELEIIQLAEETDVAVAKRSVVNADNGHYNAYIDAVRIYNPIGTLSEEESAVYAAAGELNPTFTNVNKTLLDSNSTTWGDGSSGATGVLYIGYDEKTTAAPSDNYSYSGVFLSSSGMLRTQVRGTKTYLIDENGSFIQYNGRNVYIKPKTSGTVTVSSNLVNYFYTDTTGTEHQLNNGQIRQLGLAYYENRYEAIGPENEIYLYNDNGIAFAVEPDVYVQVSAKIPYGNSAVLLQVYDAANSVWMDVANVNSRTEMYYRINSDYVANGTIILRCKIDDDPTTAINEKLNTVLSICNIKVASGSAVATDAKIKTLSYEQMAQALYAFEPKTKHVHKFVEWTVTTEPTCVENGEEISYCDCGIYDTREIAATGEHNYVDGICACGASEADEPEYALDEDLALSMDISIGAEMSVYYTVLNGKVKDYESFYIEVVKETADGKRVITLYSLENNNLSAISMSDNTLVGYSAIYTGVSAANMGDVFTATLYAVAADGTVYYGKAASESIKSYLMKVLGDESTGAELKTLAVDMLNYGAAAQIYFGYDTENLVNADLTAAQKALGTQELPTAVDTSSVSGEGATITASISLQSKVMLYVSTTYDLGADAELMFVIKDMNGNVLERITPSAIKENFYQGVYSNVGAGKMRDLVTIELYRNDVLVSQTLTWNIESFVAQTRANSDASEELIGAVNAMLTYGDSAARYLEVSGQ